MLQMTSIEQKAYDKILKIGKEHHWYFVVWDTHCDKKFAIMKSFDSIKEAHIYGAIYESLMDIVGDDENVFTFSLNINDNWQSILNKLYAICVNDDLNEGFME